jgi:hypothetical protein
MSGLGRIEIIKKIMLFEAETGQVPLIISGEIDTLKEMSTQDLRDVYKKIFIEDAKNKTNKLKTKEKETKVASLRSSKDKKFTGHTGRG